MLVSIGAISIKTRPMNSSLVTPKRGCLMVVDGELEIEDENLAKRDAIGLLEITALSMNIKANTSLLALEVPM